jgi:hypothetical protein
MKLSEHHRLRAIESRTRGMKLLAVAILSIAIGYTFVASGYLIPAIAPGAAALISGWFATFFLLLSREDCHASDYEQWKEGRRR